MHPLFPFSPLSDGTRHSSTKREEGQRMKTCLVSVLALLAFAAPAAASDFVRPTQVAAAMERHYNGAVYKARLAKADARLRSPVLCAYDGARVACTASLTFRRVPVRGSWSLQKATATRAMLRWAFVGRGVFQADAQVVRPAVFGLPVF